MDSNRLIVLGRISGAYGVKGWIKVNSETQPVQNICRYSPWYLEINGQWQAVDPLQCRKHGKGVVAQLEDCADRDKATALKGINIAIKREQLPSVDNTDDVYWTDLEGLQVENTEGIEFGKISHLFETGSNDVMVVKGERERFIPFIREQVVVRIDLDKGLVVVDWEADF